MFHSGLVAFARDRYPGVGNRFAEPDRTDAYDPAATGLTWDRTFAFLQRLAAE